MALQTKVNARSAQSTDPIRNFRFLVKISPLIQNNPLLKFEAALGFTSVSGLAISTEAIPYREGGYNTTVHQIPGQTTFSPVTFQRGVTIGSDQHYNWTQQMFRAISQGLNSSSPNQGFRANIEIDVLNHPVPFGSNATQFGDDGRLEADQAKDDLVVARFNLYNCWPTMLAYSDLNAGDNALLVEQMTIVHEGLAMKWTNKPNTAGNFTGIK
jgi:phage tail-like protein